VSLLRVALVVAGAAGLLPAVSAGADGPSARLGSAMAATHAKHSVHYVSVQKGTKAEITIVADAGPASGIQRITYRRGGKTGHVTVIVANRTAYLRGDAFTLQNYLGFTKADASRAANRWLLFPHTSPAYAPVAADVTFGSAMSSLVPRGRLAVVPQTTMAGRRVIGIRATIKQGSHTASTTLYVRAAGARLPVAEVVVGPTGRATLTYSRWNEPVSVRAPTSQAPPAAPKTPGNVA
jgi:hypothetical protein